jgi:hypothetical protein
MHQGEARDTTQDLLAAAQAAGCAVSWRQTKEWHRAGLIPKPRTLPRQRGSGTVSVYPAGTAQQVVAVCQFRQRERPFPIIAWRLWWAGYPVREAYIQATMEQAATRWAQVVADLQRWHALSQHRPAAVEELPHRTFAAVAETETVKDVDRFLGRARRQVGRQNFSTFIRVLLDIISGVYMGYADEDERVIVETALGLRLPPTVQARRRHSAPPAWFSGDTEAPLKMLSAIFRAHRPDEAVKTTGVAEWAAMRQELQTFSTVLQVATGATAMTLPLGLHQLTQQAKAIQVASPIDQAMQLLLWQAARRTDLEGQFATILRTLQAEQGESPTNT